LRPKSPTATSLGSIQGIEVALAGEEIDLWWWTQLNKGVRFVVYESRGIDGRQMVERDIMGRIHDA
jgi:hypothetical protein